MTGAILERGSSPVKGPGLLPEEARGSRQVGEGMGCIPQWRLLVTVQGGRARFGFTLLWRRSEGCRKQGQVSSVVWSSLVSIFEDHSSWGCRKETVSRCGLEVAARRQLCDQGMAC